MGRDPRHRRPGTRLRPSVTRTEFFDVVSSVDATGGGRAQTPEQIVTEALRVLNRKTRRRAGSRDTSTMPSPYFPDTLPSATAVGSGALCVKLRRFGQAAVS